MQIERIANSKEEELNKIKIEAKATLDRMRINEEESRKELYSIKAKESEYHMKIKDLEENLKDMTQAYNSMNDKNKMDRITLQEQAKKIKNLENDQFQLFDNYNSKEEELKSLVLVNNQLSQKIREEQIELHAVEERSIKLEESLLEYQFSIKIATEEKSNFQAALDKVKAENSNEMKKLKLEHEKKVESLLTKQSDMSSLMEEARVHYEDSLDAAQQKLIEIYKTKGVSDEKAALAEEHAKRLEESFEKMKIDHQSLVDQYESQQQNSASNMQNLKLMLDDALADKDKATESLLAEKERMQNKILQAENKVNDNSGHFVEMIQGMQNMFNTVNKEIISERNKSRELSNQINFLRKKLALMEENDVGIMRTLKEEFIEVYRTLDNKKEQSKEEYENLQDDMRRLELSKEEQISKTLILEEQLSRVEHENSSTLKKLGQVEKEAAYTNKKQTMSIGRFYYLIILFRYLISYFIISM